MSQLLAFALLQLSNVAQHYAMAMGSPQGCTAMTHHSAITASAIPDVIVCASETGGPASLRIFRHSISATELCLESRVRFLWRSILFV